MFDSVTSEDANQRGVGRRGVLAGVASGLNVALRGIWKYAILRTSAQVGAPLGEQRGRRIDAGKVEGGDTPDASLQLYIGGAQICLSPVCLSVCQ